jgi:iron complex transport system substrate-binding protein
MNGVSNSSGPRLPALLIVLFLAVAAGAGAWFLQNRLSPTGSLHPASPDAAGRIVSLSPAVTEVVYALGAQDRLVAVSDYCVIPDHDSRLLRVGTALTPSYETLARLEPVLILCEVTKQAPQEELAAIAPTEMLPWLTVEDMIAAVLRIGEVLGEREAAAAVAERVRTKLAVEAPADGPRVLLAMAHQPGQLSECWFIRDNSIHGSALRAAGARNAVPGPIEGVPRLSLERVIELDPEAILILSPDSDLSPEARRAMVEDWRRISPLTAAGEKRVAVVAGDSLYFTGPATIRLAERLRRALDAFAQ